MEKKYEILKDTKVRFFGRYIYRIRALKDFGNVKKGDIGGYVENKRNLSQEGNCWIYDNAVACDYSVVCENAIVKDYAIVRDYVVICGHAIIRDNTMVCDSAIVCNYAIVRDNSVAYGYVIICGWTTVYGSTIIRGNNKIQKKSTKII